MSRTVLNEKYIGKDDFHGAKYYQELLASDVSNEYIDLIVSEFAAILQEAENLASQRKQQDRKLNF